MLSLRDFEIVCVESVVIQNSLCTVVKKVVPKQTKKINFKFKII